MLLVQYYAIVKYFDVPEATEEQRSINEQYMLPDVSIVSSQCVRFAVEILGVFDIRLCKGFNMLML